MVKEKHPVGVLNEFPTKLQRSIGRAILRFLDESGHMEPCICIVAKIVLGSAVEQGRFTIRH